GLADYAELFDRHPRLHGGFIWEWIDHGIAQLTPAGEPYFGYGGDFGGRLPHGNFLLPGLVFPLRAPSPRLPGAKPGFLPARGPPAASRPGTGTTTRASTPPASAGRSRTAGYRSRRVPWRCRTCRQAMSPPPASRRR